jgi:hypothetical protein
VIAAGTSPIYDTLVGLHVVCALVGFGAVALSGIYGASWRRITEAGSRGIADTTEAGSGGIADTTGAGSGGIANTTGAGSLEESQRYFASRLWAEWLVLPVPVFGFAALSQRPGRHPYGDVWVVGGAVIWLVASLLLVAVIQPSEREIRRRLGAGIGPPAASPIPASPAGAAAPASPAGAATPASPAGAAAPAAPAAPWASPGWRLMWACAISDVLFVTALILMITQPP